MRNETEPKRVKGSGVRFGYVTLRDEIQSLQLQPGAVLDKTSLAERFSMSRSPVREALIRLAGDDRVVTLSNRSTVVAPVNVQSLTQYVEALDVARADELAHSHTRQFRDNFVRFMTRNHPQNVPLATLGPAA